MPFTRVESFASSQDASQHSESSMSDNGIDDAVNDAMAGLGNWERTIAELLRKISESDPQLEPCYSLDTASKIIRKHPDLQVALEAARESETYVEARGADSPPPSSHILILTSLTVTLAYLWTIIPRIEPVSAMSASSELGAFSRSFCHARHFDYGHSDGLVLGPPV